MVEWKELWEVTTWDKKFTGVHKHMQPKVIKYHYYLANELSELELPEGEIRILYTTEKVAYTNTNKVNSHIHEGEVVAIPWGGNPSVKYYKGKFITADNRIATSNNTEVLNNKFLYYWMHSQLDVIAGFYRGAGIKHPSMLSVLLMPIPIPSKPEQERIVKILDTFTDSIANLKAQIDARRKQYEYYRDQLLDLEGKEDHTIKCLGDVCQISKGNGVQKTDFVETGIGCIHYGQIYTHYGSYTYTTNKFVSKDVFEKAKKASKGDIIMTDTSENVDDICKSVAYLGDDDIAVSNHSFIIKHKQNPKYLSYSTLTKNFNFQKRKVVVGVKVSGIKQEHLAKIKIYLPDVLEQNRIVGILDQFEAIIANLEAQLKAREKQYEYYRNKLLTFE